MTPALMHKPSRALAIAALSALVACGGGDTVTPLPTPIGARVVYTADTDSSADWWYGDELWIADSGSTTMQVSKLSSVVDPSGFTSPVVSPGGAYVGARSFTTSGVTGPEDCPGGFQLFEAATGLRTDFLSGPHCAAAIVFSPAGDSAAVRFYLNSLAPSKLSIGDLPGFTSTIYEVGQPLASAPIRYSSDGSTLLWVQAGGLFSTNGPAAAASAHFRSADATFAPAMTPDGTKAVYPVTGGRFRVTVTTPTAPLSSTDLTAPLAAGDNVLGTALSPTGTHLLYPARISGQWQLWLVALDAPLTEQRVDAAAPIRIVNEFLPPAIAWSPDGTRFAWAGDAGGSFAQLVYAELATPTAVTALSPGTEGAPSTVLWTDDDTIAYSFGGTYRKLNAVMVTAPLTTYPLTPALASRDDVTRFERCSDGRVVALVIRDSDSLIFEAVPANSRIYSADPTVADSAVQITPTVLPGPNFDNAGITDFDCE